MRDFTCPNCGQRLAFENSVCLSCGSALGFSLNEMALLVIASGQDSDHGGAVDSSQYQLCANLHLAECNWLVEKAPVPRLCPSCPLTRTSPNDTDTEAMAAFADAETAKRRLVAELTELDCRSTDATSTPRPAWPSTCCPASREVFTGHEDGLITLDLAEGDDVHREQLRVSMDEPYRTLLGHFRHEIGHYYFYRAGRPVDGDRERFRELFGDPDLDYQQALDRHYSRGRPRRAGRTNYVSSYATMHPAEDWAETFAHYLHIRDTLDTAAAFRLRAGRRDVSTDRCRVRAGSTGSSRCGCRWPGR